MPSYSDSLEVEICRCGKHSMEACEALHMVFNNVHILPYICLEQRANIVIHLF